MKSPPHEVPPPLKSPGVLLKSPGVLDIGGTLKMKFDPLNLTIDNEIDLCVFFDCKSVS